MSGPGLSRETVEEDLELDCPDAGGNAYKKKSPGTKEIGDISVEIKWNPITPTGANQKIRATFAGNVSASGNALITITAAGMTGSPLALNVPVTNGMAPAAVKAAVATYLRTNAAAAAVRAIFDIEEPVSAATSLDLVKKNREANDATANLAIATGSATGITAAPASVQITAGVAGEENDENHHLFLDDFDKEVATFWRILHPNDAETGTIVHGTVKECGEPEYAANETVRRTMVIEPTGEFYHHGNQIPDYVLPANIEAPVEYYGHH